MRMEGVRNFPRAGLWAASDDATVSHQHSSDRLRSTNYQWFVFSDAAYGPELQTGGIGAAIFNDACECVGRLASL